jgi:antitoxin FitA
MASITIGRLDDGVNARSRLRAASHGRSMEEEAREILKAELGPKSAPQLNLAESIRQHISPLGGVDLALPPREAAAWDFARVVASRSAAGRPISQFDAMIAAIARSHQAAVATRNAGDFGHCGILVINPWAARVARKAKHPDRVTLR